LFIPRRGKGRGEKKLPAKYSPSQGEREGEKGEDRSPLLKKEGKKKGEVDKKYLPYLEREEDRKGGERSSRYPKGKRGGTRRFFIALGGGRLATSPRQTARGRELDTLFFLATGRGGKGGGGGYHLLSLEIGEKKKKGFPMSRRGKGSSSSFSTRKEKDRGEL